MDLIVTNQGSCYAKLLSKSNSLTKSCLGRVFDPNLLVSTVLRKAVVLQLYSLPLCDQVYAVAECNGRIPGDDVSRGSEAVLPRAYPAL